jgi:hypothetical protein
MILDRGMKLLPKMLAARRALAERLQNLARRLRPAGMEPSRCIAKIDRLVLGCAEVYIGALLELESYRRTGSHWIRRKNPTDFLPYGRVTYFESTENRGKVHVYSEAKSPKLPKHRIVFIPDDELGVQPEDVLAVLECVEGYSIALVELALDFPSRIGVDSEFVRRRGLFGRSKPYSVGLRPGWDAWGSRQGAKFVRSYFKEGVAAHRVELQLQPSFLRKYGIKTISHLPRLARHLPRHHVWFARLAPEKLAHELRTRGFSAEKQSEILKAVAAREPNLLSILRFLRRRTRLKNVHRLLVSLRVNQWVRDALHDWATNWSAALAKGQKS